MSLALRLNLTLHVLSAVYWVGVGLFDALVLGPVLRSFAGRPWLNEFFERLRPPLEVSVWASLGVAVATGIGNVVLLKLPLWSPRFWQSGLGHTLLLKLAAVAAILVLVAIHAFVQVPALRRLRLRAAEAAPEAATVLWEAYRAERRRAVLLPRITVGLAVAAVALGVWLTTGG